MAEGCLCLPPYPLFHLYNSDVCQIQAGLGHHNVGNQRHIRLLEPRLRCGHGHRNSIVVHVSHTVGVPLGNDQTLNLRLSQSSFYQTLQLFGCGSGLRVLAIRHGLLEGGNGAVPGLLTAEADSGKVIRRLAGGLL